MGGTGKKIIGKKVYKMRGYRGREEAIDNRYVKLDMKRGLHERNERTSKGKFRQVGHLNEHFRRLL